MTSLATARRALRLSASAAILLAGLGLAHADEAIRLGSTVEGALEAADLQLDSGESVDVFTLTGRAGDRVEIALSASFDAYVFIEGPDGFAAFNDDDALQPGVVDSRLAVTLPADGAYRVAATSYAPGETGRYTLTVEAGSASVPGVYDLALGETGTGTLGRGDITAFEGKFVDVWTFEGRRGERVRLDLASADFDAYLTVVTPEGEIVENDDSEDGTDSRINTALAADGQYVVYVTSYEAAERGAYRLSLAQSLGSERQQSVLGGQRVFGVFVGLSDYPGEANDLPDTADDAQELADVLWSEGVLNPASVVLTDEDATRANVAAAVREVAAAAGPDDLFVFFYSGHGDQTDRSADGEIDGRDEAIVLYDGNLLDGEMAELMDGVDARLALVALDSCFSGGFDRDLIDRPGIMGLFSSDEDLTSVTAGEYDAGGYLAWFLQEGLAGAADLDFDRMLTAGELSAYMRGAFAAEVVDVSAVTVDGQQGYQAIVVDRGAVQLDDVVFRFGGMV